jgi:hypothetical protein
MVSMRQGLSIRDAARKLSWRIRKSAIVSIFIVVSQTAAPASATNCEIGWTDYQSSSTALNVCWKIKDGILSVAAHYPGNVWLAIGFGTQMVGSRAVVGMPSVGRADEYDIQGFTADKIVPVKNQTTLDRSFVAYQQGSVLQFKKKLRNEDSIPIIWAVGPTQELGMHMYRGTFVIGHSASDGGDHATPKWLWVHAMAMVASWGFVLPLGVLIARISKVGRGQDWPKELHNLTWWYWHQFLQYTGLAIFIVGLWVVFNEKGDFAFPVSTASLDSS